MLEIELVILLTSEAVLATVETVDEALPVLVLLFEPLSWLAKEFTVAWLTCWLEVVLALLRRLARPVVLTFPSDEAKAEVMLLELVCVTSPVEPIIIPVPKAFLYVASDDLRL